jgi:hypothetical protein
MTDAPAPQKTRAEMLASVLLKCRAGIATSRAEVEHALQRLDEVESTLGQLAAMAEKGAKPNE